MAGESIPLSVNPPAPPANVLGIMGQAAALRDMQSQQRMRDAQTSDIQAQAQERNRVLQGRQALSQILKSTQGTDPVTGKPIIMPAEEVAKHMSVKGFPDLGSAYLKQASESEEAADKLHNLRLQHDQTAMSWMADRVKGIQDAPEGERPALYASAIEQGKALGLPVPSSLPPEWDDAKAAAALPMLMTNKDRLEQALKGSEIAKNAATAKESTAKGTQAEAETDYLKNFGKLSGTEAFAVGAYAQKLHKNVADLGPDEKAQAMQFAKVATEDPAMRAATLALQAATLANKSPTGAMNQEKLEQQYRGVLEKTLSSRSGGMGLEDQKVNQAKHLLSIFDQNRDKDGNYTIPKVLQTEVAMGLARLVSPGGQVGEGTVNAINQKTAAGDIAGLVTYLTGQPVTGNTQAVFKMFKDSIERQAKVAQSNRQTYLDAIKSMAPTDLEPERLKKVEGALKLNTVDTPSSGTIRARDPQGKLHEAPAGTALPAGWTIEK